jgi:hypothetical protein
MHVFLVSDFNTYVSVYFGNAELDLAITMLNLI